MADDAGKRWAAGHGPISHSEQTRSRIQALARSLAEKGITGDGVPLFEILHAADRVASGAMWLVVHQTYARNVRLEGGPLAPEDLKEKPDGHTGGSLNMVPAYVGYMAANAITGFTRSWIMGQGHCVSAIDSVNLLLGNMTPAHAERYPVSDEGLTRYVRDFYSLRLGPGGEQDSPVGSHVNVHTAGGLAEAGYLGFIELGYVHMPLPGERLVAFLSDGAFEEQRGSDWASRWWRAEDSGLVTPIMINNGRRIDQRTTCSQQGGSAWLAQHLKLNGFDPFEIDGRDPAAFAWAILEGEARLDAAAAAVRSGSARYPVPLPYCIAVAPKGAGFPGEGTNLAHNLPLPGNPRTDAQARALFNEGAHRLWVPPAELLAAAAKMMRHGSSGRAQERDHALAKRSVELRSTPALELRPVPEDRSDPSRWTRSSPMEAVDRTFLSVVLANPHLRPRVGNPDEMKSNRMIRTLESLKFRVTDPEPGIPESVAGAVITALNEEAVAAAAIGNTGGINIVVTYEAFGAKMQGLFRQEVIWAAHRSDAGQPPGRLSVPLVLTSHTWENSKNEQSHQDPVMAESMMGERADFSRVLFAADANTAAAIVAGVFATQGQVWTLVVPKLPRIADLFTPKEARALLERGAARLDWAGHRAREQRVVLTAVGAYQLEQALAASRRLAARDVAHSVVYMIEPGRFRAPSCAGEEAHAVSERTRSDLYPVDVPARVFVTHTRPGPLLGTLHRLHTGERTAVLRYQNRGGTLDVDGLLFVNRSTWAHVVDAVARVTGTDRRRLLLREETDALDGRVSPHGPVIPDPGPR